MPTEDSLPSDVKLNGADRHYFHSDAELVRRWMYSQVQRSPTRGRGIYLWAKISEVFSVGSTSAQEICRRHGYDPDRMVRRAA
jgi:hypothetical protein